MSSQPDVSVVIPTHDGVPLLGEQLDALVRQTYSGPIEVVVSDNRSSDGTAAFARRWSPPLDLVVAAADEGVGVNHARQAGVRASHGALVLICDADDVVSPEWVERMVDALADHDVVGGPLRLDRLNPPHVIAWYPEEPIDRLPATEGVMPYAIGANCGFHRRVFDAIGGYDVALAGGGDDIDFSWRAQRAGFRIGFAPGAWIDYRLRSDLGSLFRQMRARGRGVAALHRKSGLSLSGRGALSGPRLLWWLCSRAPFAAVDRRRRGSWVRAIAFEWGLRRG